MKTIVSIFAMIFIAFGPIYYNFYLTEKPDIKYFISETIPTDTSSEKSQEILQQLEVKNIGNSKAEKIHVKIIGKIISHRLIKSIVSDIAEPIKQPEFIDLLYPELLPQSSFKLIVKSFEPIKKDDISINFDKGKATEALTPKSISALDYSSIVSLFFYLFLSIFTLKNLFKSSLEIKSKYYPDNVLKSEKPFYLNENEWKDIRIASINNLIDKDLYLIEYKNLKSFKILNEKSKIKFITDQEWDLLVEICCKNFELFINTKLIPAMYFTKDFIDNANITKPINYPENKWKEIEEKINRQYISLKITDLKFLSIKNIIIDMKLNKLDFVSEESHRKIYEAYKSELITKINGEMQYQLDSIKYLNSFDLDILDDTVKESIFLKAQEINNVKYTELYFNAIISDVFSEDLKNKCIDEKTWNKFIEFNEIVTKLRQNERLMANYNKKLELLNLVFKKEKMISRKPQELTEDDWKTLNDVYDQIENLTNDSINVKNLKIKIEKQLNIIDQILNIDFNIINRIEEYDDTFSKGNFNNLVKLSKILSQNIEILKQ